MSIETRIRNLRRRFPNYTTVFIWGLAVLVLTGLMVNDFVPLLNQYQDDNIETNAVVVLENLTLQLPDLALCILNDNEKKIDFGNGTNASSILVKQFYGIHENFTFQKKYSAAHEFMNSTLITATLMLLKALDFMDSTPEHVRDDLQFLQNRDLAFTNELAPEKLIPLADLIAQTYCMELLDSSTYQGGPLDTDSDVESYCSNLSSTTTPYTISSSQFCFPLPLSRVAFTREDVNNVRIYLKTRSPWLRWSSAEIYDNSVGRYGSALYKLSSQTRSLVANFKLQSLVRSIAKNRNCVKESNYDSCMAKCRVTNVQKNCGCTPFTYRLWSNTDNLSALPYCSKSNYASCLKRFRDTDEMLNSVNCRQECQSLCTYGFYQWSFQEKIETSEDAADAREVIPLNFRPNSYSYIEFQLDQKMSVEQFLTQIGGLLNFYIGASGLTIFTVLLAFSNWLKKQELVKKTITRRLSKTPETRTSFDPAATIWQWWWIKQWSEKAKREQTRENDIRRAVQDVAQSLGWFRNRDSDNVNTDAEERFRCLESDNALLISRISRLEDMIKKFSMEGDKENQECITDEKL